MEKNLTESIENYLEYLYIKELEGYKEIKSNDVAEHFNFSRAAITKAMEKLVELGYVNKAYYGSISLTNEGRKIALATYEKHITIKKMLEIIGVDEETANIDCCKIEHQISEITFNKIKEFVNKYSK